MQIKKMGILKMLGQVMFLVLIVPWLRKKASWCRLQLIQLYQLDNTDFNAGQLLQINLPLTWQHWWEKELRD